MSVLANPIILDEHEGQVSVYLMFTDVDGTTYLTLVDRAEVLASSGDDSIITIYEVNEHGHFREVWLEVTPTIRTGEWQGGEWRR